MIAWKCAVSMSAAWLSLALPTASTAPDSQQAGAAKVLILLVSGAGLIAVICAALYYLHRAVQRRRRFSHAGLFAGLCRAHKLNRRHRAMLKQVARYHRSSQPARIFVDPSWLDPAKLVGPLARWSQELAKLRERLFGQPTPPAEPQQADAGAPKPQQADATSAKPQHTDAAPADRAPSQPLHPPPDEHAPDGRAADEPAAEVAQGIAE